MDNKESSKRLEDRTRGERRDARAEIALRSKVRIESGSKAQRRDGGSWGRSR